ncbi:hypothetical protein HHK36_022962 [Tetracentron sinense]|uniref:CW-type domain-containing protein n=1 Tax=Tetracentron sinense TaxID=13715 RepID=A0A834YQY6_TETSI|nr:hypothetical protein HHK36_022962 [Tetracentron sinense]
MLSVGSRNGRKGLGFGIGGEMEETELEEGEACYYRDDNTSIDPDVSLSYIDEKLQDVLGHFQKDFEGGVSAENLGAKFGGYGSFLPAYQRSPSIWSHPRTPQKLQNYNTLRSPNNLPLEEGACQDSTVPSSAPISVRLGPAFSSAVPLPVSRAQSVHNSVKRDVSMSSSWSAEELTPKHEPLNKLIAPTDQKLLKVRIKMGSDSMSAKKNAAIYSGLGLDISPSPSLEDSPAESGGMSPESKEREDESPTSILQIMTSFHVPGGLLLSPVPNSLLRLTENEKLQRDSRSGTVCKRSHESSVMLVDESASIRGDRKVFGERKTKSVEKIGSLVELNGNGKDAEDDNSALLGKEKDIETPAGNKLVSNALKLPPLSNSKCTVGDTAKGIGKASDISREVNKGAWKDKFFSSDFEKGEAFESTSIHDVSSVENQNAKISSAEEVWEDKKASSHKDVSADDRRKDGKGKGDKSYDPFKAVPGVSKRSKDLKVGRKATSHEQDGMNLYHSVEQPSYGGKKKSKGSQIDGTPKESLRVGSAVPNDKNKSTHVGDYPSKGKVDDINLRQELRKAKGRYRDLFGDVKFEQAEKRTDLLKTPSKERPKDSKLEVVEKEMHAFTEKSKERSSVKKDDNSLTSVAYLKTAPNIASLTGNTPVSDAAPALGPPLVIEENWVCCDKCQKWRLLPFGTNPNHLPKKWLCSMLNWLPGMNRCNISEEETTKALNALYQPVPESQNNLCNHPDGAASRVPFADMRHLDQNHQDLSFQAERSGGKKKPGSKETSNVASHSGPMQFSNSTKKIQEASVKSRSLDDVNQSPLESSVGNIPGCQHLSKSSDFDVEKHGHKQKEKPRLLERSSDGGEAKHSKTKSSREANQEGFKASKKIRAEGMYYTDEDWRSDHDGGGGAIRRVGPSSSSGLPTTVTGKDLHKYNADCPFKESKCDATDSLLVSVKKLKDQVQVSLDGETLNMGNYNDRDIAVKKRKVKEWQESQIYSKTLPRTEHHLQDNRISEKETSESEHRKEKKTRVFKSEGKDSKTSKGDGRTDKKDRVARILLSGSRDHPVYGMEEEGRSIEKECHSNIVFQQTLDGINSLKKDLGCGQPSMAATSSSSKVSDSHKTKANFQEVKGSPVESVSSSPLRISNPEKLTSVRRNLLGKDDTMNAGFSVIGSPRRCSDGGSDRSGTRKAFSVIHRGSLESSVLDYHDRDANHTLDGKAKTQTETSPEFENNILVNGGADNLGQHYQYPSELQADHRHNEKRVNSNHYHANGSLARKSGKGSSSRSKDKHRGSKSDFDRGKIKASDLFGKQEEFSPSKSLRNEAEIESHDRGPYHEEMKNEKFIFQEKYVIKSEKDRKNYVDKKESSGKWSSESSKRGTQLGGYEDSGVKLGAICRKNGKFTSQQNLLQDHGDEDRTDPMEIVSGRGKSQLVPFSGDKQETLTRCPGPAPGSHQGGGSDSLPVDASGGGDVLKAPKQPRKTDNQNGAHHSSLRHPTPNEHGIRDLDAPSPVRKDSSSQAAANALKEATGLKHSADRLKNHGSDLESTRLYFEAALKFLHGASLLEPCNSENAKHGDVIQSMQVYRDTAKLCEFCAHEYERCKDMAAAALAYKCMEVAYMRVIYSKHSGACRDRHELQMALQVAPPGESPSSSASDVDNLNNQATLDKTALAKGISSPQIAGNHVIVARNRPNFLRLLTFARDVNLAMEASRNSQIAFAAANVSLEARYGEGISSVKRVLDFNFQDVEGLLRLVRLAMDAISR